MDLLDDALRLSVLTRDKEVTHGADGADLEEALVLEVVLGVEEEKKQAGESSYAKLLAY
jgi:hypothetical protein